jgi:hypothetical protein
MEAVLPPEPGDVYGDSAFAGSRSERAIAVRRGRPQMVKTGTWGGPDALACRQRHMQGCSVCALAFEKLAFCPASVFYWRSGGHTGLAGHNAESGTSTNSGDWAHPRTGLHYSLTKLDVAATTDEKGREQALRYDGRKRRLGPLTGGASERPTKPQKLPSAAA